MKMITATIALVSAAALCAGLLGCSSGPSAPDDSASAVEITVVAKALAGADYTISITGPGMSPMGPYTYISASGETIELTVPRGDSRNFRFERRLNNVLTDTGTTVKDIRNAVEIVTVTLVALGSPPVISQSPANVTVNPGVRARFTVDASGSSIDYRWYRDGALLVGENSSSYELSSPQASDSGSYFICEAYNTFGSAFSDTAWLRVVTQAVQPVILYGPDDDTVAVGDTAVFRVSAAGIGLTFTWYRDGIVIAGETDTVLKVPGVAPADSGSKFVCIVGNTAGNNSTREAVLHVVAAAPRLVWHTDTVPDRALGVELSALVVTPDLIVAAGRYGTIYTSPNAFPPLWTKQGSPTTVWIYGLCWSGTRFVAVGRDGHILTSDNGIDWVTRVSGTSRYLQDVAWNGSSFIAVGDAVTASSSGTVLASTDAVTWSPVTTPAIGSLYGVKWINNQWLLTGVNTVLSSVDGTTWRGHSAPFMGGGQFNPDDIYNFLLCDVAFSGTDYIFTSTTHADNVYTTADLSVWQNRSVTPDIDQAGAINIVWTGTHFATVNWSSSAVSVDGMSWTEYSMTPHGTNAYESLVFTGTHLLTVGGFISWAEWPW